MVDGEIIIKLSAEEKEFQKELIKAEKDAKKYANKIEKYSMLISRRKFKKQSEFKASGAQEEFDKAKKSYEDYLKNIEKARKKEKKMKSENKNLDKAYDFDAKYGRTKGYKGLLSANLKKWDVDPKTLEEYKNLRSTLSTYDQGLELQRGDYEKAKSKFETKKQVAEAPDSDMKRWSTILEETNIDYMQTLGTITELEQALDQIHEKNKEIAQQMEEEAKKEEEERQKKLADEKRVQEVIEQADREIEEENKKRMEASILQAGWKAMDDRDQKKLEQEYYAQDPKTRFKGLAKEINDYLVKLKEVNKEEDELGKQKGDKQFTKTQVAAKKAAKPMGFLQKRMEKLRNSVRFLGFQMKTALLWGVVLMPLMKVFDVLRDNLMSVTKQNSAFTASLANLKGTLWTATAPALLAITDALTIFMNKLAYVITYISTFVNAMLGLKKVSKETVKSMASAKDKKKGAGGKDKGLSLASWDTVQQLQKPSSGGGASDDDVIPPTFEQDFSDAEAALEHFKQILEDDGWFGVGEEIGRVITEGIVKIDVVKIAQGLSDGIKAAIELLAGLISGIDFVVVGEKIREFILNIDWLGIVGAVFDLLGQAIIAGLELISGLFNIDLSFITEAFTALFDFIRGDTSFKEFFDTLSTGQLVLLLFTSLLTGAVIWTKLLALKTLVLNKAMKLFHITLKLVKLVFGGLSLKALGIIVIISLMVAAVIAVIKHWDWLKEKVLNVFHIILDAIKNFCDKWSTFWDDLLTGLKTGFKNWVNGIISLVEKAINWIIDKLNILHIDAPDWMKEKFGVEGVGFNFDRVKFPRLAQGGVVNPGHQFAAILGDNRREQEIVSPLSTMKEALMEALRDSGAYHSGNITLQIDGQTFARITNPYLQNETNRIGIVATGG